MLYEENQHIFTNAGEISIFFVYNEVVVVSIHFASLRVTDNRTIYISWQLHKAVFTEGGTDCWNHMLSPEWWKKSGPGLALPNAKECLPHVVLPG